MLGESLLDSGAITPGQLDRALAAQRVSGNLLGDVLLSMQLVSDEALSRALAREAGTPFVAGDHIRVDPSAAALVPEPFARRHLVVPLGMRGHSLEVLQANPFDVIALDDLSRLVRLPLVPFCATPGDVRRAIDGCYHERQATARPARVKRAVADLGLSRRQEAQFLEMLARERGLILVAGPDGSGKRTTVESAIGWLGDSKRRAAALGDLHTPEAARRALRTAGAGALVFGTLRSSSALRALTDLRELDIDRHQLASVLVGILSQRLVRRMCEACAAPVNPSPELLARVGLDADPGVVFRKGRGCAQCAGTGYVGTTAVFEVLEVDAPLRDAIDSGVGSQTLATLARRALGHALLDRALTTALFGRTTLDEVAALVDGVP